MRRAGEGVQRTFEDWYRQEHPRLLGLLTVVSGDRDVAKEATAEAFTRALELWDRVGAMEAPAAWTYRVGVNVVKRRLRRARVEHVLTPRLVDVEPPRTLDPRLWRAVRDLPVRQRTALALRYVCDLTQADVARVMGIAPGTVSATLTASRRRLAEVLGPEAVEEVSLG